MSSSESKSLKSSKSLLVVFDIDETLIQFIPKKYESLWEQRKNAFHPDQYHNDKGSIIIFRPFLKELFSYLQKDKFFKVALWTLSEREYCEDIASILTRHFGLKSDFFISKKGYEDTEDANPKELRLLWEEFPQYNKFNTVLIDDRYANMNHSINRENGIAIQPFAPFGTDKKRELISETEFTMQLQDNVFEHLIDIFEKIKRDIKGCTSEEIAESLDSYSLITPQRIKRMALTDFMQPFPTKVENIMRIGMPFVSEDYVFMRRGMRGGKNRKSKNNRKSKKLYTRRHKK